VEDEIRKEIIGIPDDYFEGLDKDNMKVYKGDGCEKCGHTGYSGRMGIFEVLPSSPEIQDLILAKSPSRKIYEEAQKIGMISLKQDGMVKVLRGDTTMEEVIRVTTE
jgi:type IV pilus assembly protein PilB